jgi:hypothetical protein
VQEEVIGAFAEMGQKPEEVSEDVRERYVKYLERMKKQSEKAGKKAGKVKT